MSRFYMKPVLWNTFGYEKPAGFAAKGGFPLEHGYGHEEWNNSPVMAFQAGGIRRRAFHTEQLGNAPLKDSAGRTFVFMYASHNRVQELVGIAGNATCLIGEDHQAERIRLTKRLKLARLWRDAWSTPSVQACYDNDRAAFRENWVRDLHCIPNWTCPDDLFFWLRAPIKLSPKNINNKHILPHRFNAYMEITPFIARTILDWVPPAQRTAPWANIVAAIGTSSNELATDIDAINSDSTIGRTMKQALISARIGQGKFREQLMQRWGGGCAVTGCMQPEVLRASHIKPWRVSKNAERRNPANGLLLSANLDALFDKGLITFDDQGTMLASPRLPQAERVKLGVPASLRHRPSAAEARFLEHHRNVTYR